MTTPSSPPLSGAARLAIAALGALGLVGGWLILLSGGFEHAPHRYTNQTTRVDGAPALAMAAICFVQAAIGVLALLPAAAQARRLAGVAAVLLPPLAFVLLR